MAKVENVGQIPKASIGLLKIATITRGHDSRISQPPINDTMLIVI